MLLFPMLSFAGEITKVSVTDTQFRPIKVITTEDDITRFKEIWSAKKTMGPMKVRWAYLLDISTESSGDRWRYHPDGWAQVLSMKHAETYKVRSAQDLNQLLGVKATGR